LARLHQMRQPAQWAEFAGAALRSQPQSNPPAEAETVDDLMAQANRFAEIHLPILEALGIA
jgi:hypothetical protein